VAGRGRASGGGAGGGRASQGTRGASGVGLQEARETAGGGGITGAAKAEEGGWEVEDRGIVAKSQNCRDSTIKPRYLSNHSSNENVPKSKSVGFSKIYNFALRFSCKRAKDLKLT
jgi:hypothetical protein